MIPKRSKKEMISLAAIAVLFFVSIALVESFALETNTDRPGMDYSNFDLASAIPVYVNRPAMPIPIVGPLLTSSPVFREQTPDAG